MWPGRRTPSRACDERMTRSASDNATTPPPPITQVRRRQAASPPRFSRARNCKQSSPFLFVAALFASFVCSQIDLNLRLSTRFISKKEQAREEQQLQQENKEGKAAAAKAASALMTHRPEFSASSRSSKYSSSSSKYSSSTSKCSSSSSSTCRSSSSSKYRAAMQPQQR